MSNEKVIRANGVDLCVETFGAGPAVLLIGGHSASMLWWPEEFCERLAAAGRQVIRYDNRDTGRSVRYPLTKPGYAMADLVEDAVGLLDALGADRAHVVGMSMGGGIAQLVALSHPDRLAVIEYLVDNFRAFAGSLPFDEDDIRAIAGRDVDRAGDIAVELTNHAHIKSTEEPVRTRLGEINAPTLILHGTDDPLLPLPHGEVLARDIPDARLVPMKGAGHELPRAVWDEVIPELVKHTSAG